MNPSHPELWYEDNATPRFGIMQVDPRGKMVALEITLGENGIDYSKTVIPSPASISTLLPSSTTTTTEEEDILHLEELPNFDNALSPEEAAPVGSAVGASEPEVVGGAGSADADGDAACAEKNLSLIHI